jgi:hypothetical protein
MCKFIAVLIVVAGAFGAGYYVGQRPVGTLKKTLSDLSARVAISKETAGDFQQSLKTLSRNALDTFGIERDLRRRQGLVEAKSRLVQAKADILDRNFGDAAQELDEAATALETAARGTKTDAPTDAVLGLSGSLRTLRLEVAAGKSASLKKLDDLQRRMDQLLNQ